MPAFKPFTVDLPVTHRSNHHHRWWIYKRSQTPWIHSITTQTWARQSVMPWCQPSINRLSRCSIKHCSNSQIWMGTTQAWQQLATVTTSTQPQWIRLRKSCWVAEAKPCMVRLRTNSLGSLPDLTINFRCNSHTLAVATPILDSDSPELAAAQTWQEADVMVLAPKAHLKCTSKLIKSADVILRGACHTTSAKQWMTKE